jgi:ABC-type dipeptide/oligopeptide/nickel transport system permease component
MIPVIIACLFDFFFMISRRRHSCRLFAPTHGEQQEALRHDYGYDGRSCNVRQIHERLVTGDLGTSYLSKRPVWGLV